MRRLFRAVPLLLLVLLLCASASFGQGARYDNIAYVSGANSTFPQFASGVNVAVCQGLVTTAASISGNVATLTFASNPITAGFTLNSTLVVAQFTGADAYFNGSFPITGATSSTISYNLTHANASASSNGNVVQQGTSSTACLPLASLFTDSTLTTASANPFVADFFGNYGFWANPAIYQVQLYGSSVTTSIKQISLGCVPNASSSGLCGAQTNLPNTFTAPQTFSGGLTSSGTGTFANINKVIYVDQQVGVDPTGVTDSTTGIQTALNALNTQGGGTARFSCGTYKTTSTLNGYGNINYDFDGYCAILKPTSAVTGEVIKFANQKNVNWRSGVIDLSTAGTNVVGIHAAGLWFGTFFAPRIIQGPSGSTGILIETSAVGGNNFGSYIIKIIGADLQSGAGQYGIRTMQTPGDTFQVTHLTIDGGWISKKTYGLYLDQLGTGRVSDTVIDTATDGIHVTNSFDLVLQPGEIGGGTFPGFCVNAIPTNNQRIYLTFPSVAGTCGSGQINSPNNVHIFQAGAVRLYASSDQTYYAEFKSNFSYGSSFQLNWNGGGSATTLMEAGDALGFTLRGTAASVGNMINLAGNLAGVKPRGSIKPIPLGTPNAPGVVVNGATGSTSYTYFCVVKDVNGLQTVTSAATTISNGNATLSVSNFNAVTCGPWVGAISYDVLKTNTSTLLGNVVPTIFGAAVTLNDTGQATSGYAAQTIDQTSAISANILAANASFSSDAGGHKHKRFGATTATAATVGAQATTSYTWTTAFADANYTVSCTGVTPTGTPSLGLNATQTAAGITVVVTAITAVASSYAAVDCVADHD